MGARTKQLHVRVAMREYADICRNAKLAGLSLSEFTRKLLTGEVVKERPPVELRTLYTEINHIGRNINQIAKAVNAGIATPEQVKQSQFLLSKIYELLDERLV